MLWRTNITFLQQWAWLFFLNCIILHEGSAFVIQYEKSKLPTETQLLFECFMQKEALLSLEQKSSLFKNLELMQAGLQSVPANNALTFFKEQLYRFLMEQLPSEALDNTPLTPNEFPAFFKYYQEVLQTKHCSFTSWIVSAIQADYNQAQKNSSNTIKKEKIIRYLSNWIKFLKQSSSSSTETDKILLNFYLMALESLAQQVNLFKKFSPPTTEPVFYFSLNKEGASTPPMAANSNAEKGNTNTNPSNPLDNLSDLVEENKGPDPARKSLLDQVIKKQSENANSQNWQPSP